uniref:Uncharacterized protein n=2 Tax=Lotharella oceanica TaxID=641309 RepID=A0A7S2TK69_9EUKA|mmetsp:Transcript_16437/g.31172  ORF Transcript_16437/g.31172 Transcript_16437/m.31172 type:complete len:113 (+) Transcript_16437:489-827(+)
MPRINLAGTCLKEWKILQIGDSLSSPRSCRFASVKFQAIEGKQRVRKAAEELANALQADVVQVVGHTAVLCRDITPGDPIFFAMEAKVDEDSKLDLEQNGSHRKRIRDSRRR